MAPVPDVLIGVLLATVGLIVVAVKLRGNRENARHSSSALEKNDVTSPVAETRICFAAVVTTEQIREIGPSPEKAATLVAAAAMRWAGSEAAWENLVARMSLPALSACPADESKDVIIVFTGSLPESKIPTNRLTMRNCMNNLTVKGALTFSGLYDRPLTVNPMRFGFEEM